MDYTLLKVAHIGALILWLGPALGAWIAYKTIDKEPVSSVTQRLNAVFYAMVTLEHLAFAVLITSGLAMAMLGNWFDTQWLTQKLWLVLVIIIPLEIVDVVLGNWLAAKAAKKQYQGLPLNSSEQSILLIYHGPFTKLAIALIPLSVLLVMYLAVSKQALY
ncbi:DUF2269 domain-containing protein [Pseudoalteromonas sp. SSDWG2]|uniref:DUF2269 domain-containing protein n=1 Tax=Pseudoalteromonas sp. SSDWG2 TaxID=3139391 RepID=UPI003BA910E3